jgi:hypothetical protein
MTGDGLAEGDQSALEAEVRAFLPSDHAGGFHFEATMSDGDRFPIAPIDRFPLPQSAEPNCESAVFVKRRSGPSPTRQFRCDMQTAANVPPTG